MSSSAVVYQLMLTITVFSVMISAKPMIVVGRRVSTPSTYLQALEQLEILLNEEKVIRQQQFQPSFDEDRIVQRFRKSIPDGYFEEFSVAGPDSLLNRQRRGQPITDYTDEFSADPFEISVTDAIAEKTTPVTTKMILRLR